MAIIIHPLMLMLVTLGLVETPVLLWPKDAYTFSNNIELGHMICGRCSESFRKQYTYVALSFAKRGYRL